MHPFTEMTFRNGTKCSATPNGRTRTKPRDAVERSLGSDACTEEQKEQARGAFRRLEGTDMERLLRASILGSSEKLKRYMDLYLGQNEGRPLTRKTKESILGIFDIEEYV